MTVYVGVDWSAKGVVCATGEEVGEIRRINGAEPTLASVSDLMARVRARHGGESDVRVVLESGRRCWARLFLASGAAVHVVDAGQSKSFAKSLCSSGAKDDGRDCETMVKLGRSAAHLPAEWTPNAEEYEQLEAVEALRSQLSNAWGRVVNQLRAAMADTMPMVSAALPSLDYKWVVGFLREVPTGWHASRLSRRDFDLLLQGSGSHRKSREALWEALARTEAPWLREAVAKVLGQQMRALLEQLEVLTRQLAQAEAELDALTRQMPVRPILESVDGIALRQCASLIRFGFGAGDVTHRDAVGVRMGACPVFGGSGSDKHGKPKGKVWMRRACSSRARRTVYLLGRLAAQHLRWAAAMYADGVARGQSAATAYRRVARSLLRILTAMVRDGTPYDEERYIAILKSKGLPWAVAMC